MWTVFICSFPKLACKVALRLPFTGTTGLNLPSSSLAVPSAHPLSHAQESSESLYQKNAGYYNRTKSAMGYSTSTSDYVGQVST